MEWVSNSEQVVELPFEARLPLIGKDVEESKGSSHHTHRSVDDTWDVSTLFPLLNETITVQISERVTNLVSGRDISG